MKFAARWAYAWFGWLGIGYYATLAHSLALVHGTGIEWTFTLLACLAGAFLPLEGAAVVVNAADAGPERARTLSQLMQYVAKQRPGVSWWQSWDAMVTVTAFMVGFLTFYVVAPISWWGATVAGLGVFSWNWFHWHDRGTYG